MTINIQYVHMDTSESMNAYVTKKLDRLREKYYWIIKATVRFKRQQVPKGKGRICRIELSVPGPFIYAASNQKNYELAVKRTVKELEKQLKKRKEVFKTR